MEISFLLCPQKYFNMPITQQTMEADVRDEIVAKLKDEGRSLSWMTKKLDMNYNTFYAMFVHKTISLKEPLKQKVNDILGTSY